MHVANHGLTRETNCYAVFDACEKLGDWKEPMVRHLIDGTADNNNCRFDATRRRMHVYGHKHGDTLTLSTRPVGEAFLVPTKSVGCFECATGQTFLFPSTILQFFFFLFNVTKRFQEHCRLQHSSASNKTSKFVLF